MIKTKKPVFPVRPYQKPGKTFCIPTNDRKQNEMLCSPERNLTMNRILVLMATYNGASYLREQLDSILNQKDVQVNILISDDCSEDETGLILEEYSRKHPNIHVLRNDANQGYRKNFIHLIQKADDGYDFYALADQDDVWMDDKLKTASRKLEKFGKETPNLYYSNLTVADSRLNPIGMMEKEDDIRSFQRIHLLLENKCTGCTAVFNPKMKEYILRLKDDMILLPHDEIISRISLLYGEYFYDQSSHILYRQHQNNQIGTNKKHKLRKYLSFLFKGTEQYHGKDIDDLISLFGPSDRIPEAETISGYEKSFGKRMKILFSRSIRKKGFKANFIFKIAILIKKY